MVAIHNGALYLINNLENIVVILGFKVVFNHNQTKFLGYLSESGIDIFA